ncbi:MAG: cytochrome C oxidase subunit IV family protein [Saprospiraceae bacterium]|jgi:cytochrome c oxidase subunit 4|nr:cytochrome C oxidase subunit IV family protein [Saprospiraceae bacterium]
MGHLSYEASKSIATTTILKLAAITVFEVVMALLGKGYIIDGVHFPWYIMAILMIGMSIVKAYLIIYEFMHMKYEVPGLVKTVLLPTLLLVWAVIAFLYEGNYWNDSRQEVINKVKTELPAENPNQRK